MITPTIGTKVVGEWGAMHPLSYGVIDQLGYGRATIKWGAESCIAEYEEIDLDKIHQPGWTSANGSGIGIFYECEGEY